MSETNEFISLVKRERTPCVFADYHIDDPAINCVDLDYAQSGYIAARHLIQKGHTHIIYIDPGTGSIQERERLEGVKRAFTEHGIPLTNLAIEESSPDDMITLENVIAKRHKYSAVIVAWVHKAIALLYIANINGIRVPDKFEVVSLAGSRYLNLIHPRLTSTDLPLYDLGVKCAEVILDNLYKAERKANLKLPCKLVIRDTS